MRKNSGFHFFSVACFPEGVWLMFLSRSIKIVYQNIRSFTSMAVYYMSKHFSGGYSYSG